MTSICAVADNRDFEPHLPVLIDCFASPDQLTECIRLLSNTTFVQDVTMPALAILVPILVRSLNERSADILRRAVIIVDNVFKMVKDPMEGIKDQIFSLCK